MKNNVTLTNEEKMTIFHAIEIKAVRYNKEYNDFDELFEDIYKNGVIYGVIAAYISIGIECSSELYDDLILAWDNISNILKEEMI